MDLSKVPDRFWEKIKLSTTGCWEWTASTRKNGYGRFNNNGYIQEAHRYIYFITFPGTDSTYHILHKCDNRKCVNPSHLFHGTHLDNMRDMKNKLRSNNQRKTHCIAGHEYNELNTYYHHRTKRNNIERLCKICLKLNRYKRNESSKLSMNF